MAVLIDVNQDKRRNSNKLWYGRAKCLNTIDTRGLAHRIQSNVSVKESDVYAVLIELAEVMSYELSNSMKIQLDRFGYFYPSVHSSGALTKAEWNVTENIKDGTVRFTPFRTQKSTAEGGGVTSRSLSGTGFQYKVVDFAETENKPEP